jgi:hypothetical protein
LNFAALTQSKSADEFHAKRGEAKAYIGLLEWLSVMEYEITTNEGEAHGE